MPARKRKGTISSATGTAMGSTRRSDLRPKRELSDAALLRSAEKSARKFQADLERERRAGR